MAERRACTERMETTELLEGVTMLMYNFEGSQKPINNMSSDSGINIVMQPEEGQCLVFENSRKNSWVLQKN